MSKTRTTSHRIKGAKRRTADGSEKGLLVSENRTETADPDEETEECRKAEMIKSNKKIGMQEAFRFSTLPEQSKCVPVCSYGGAD